MKTLLLLDLSNMIFKAMGVKKPMIYRGKNTKAFYVFLQIFCSMIQDIAPTDVILTVDKSPYIRKEIYPEYKGNRPELDKSILSMIFEGKKYALDFVNMLGIPIWEMKGYEADDLIALACIRYTNWYDNIVIASNDDDLYQLFLYPNVKLYNSKKKEFYTREQFVNTYKIEPTDWIYVTALSGTHNNIKGVKGIGPVNALRLLQDLNNGKPDEFNKIYEEHHDLINKYIDLIELPINFDKLDIAFENPIPNPKSTSREIFNTLIREYGFNVEPYMQNAIDFLLRR